MRILITGGAGFVGASLAQSFRTDFPNSEIIAFDNLRRRGSELNLGMFKRQNITFVHGDIRSINDLADLEGSFDIMIEASAEPSVHAGVSGSPAYLLESNLVGTLNCLAFARDRVDSMIFLSTSRVYSLEPLQSLILSETATRFVPSEQDLVGFSNHGIAESFSTVGPRSLYGASKLASEIIAQEYADTYGKNIIINRCGVLAGPGQFGKVDQGVVALWVASHTYDLGLTYTGFGGTGKQVRDLLHPKDLYRLILKQLLESKKEVTRGQIYNVGGGINNSISLLELTQLCQKTAGRMVSISSRAGTARVDIPYYVSDFRKAEAAFDWQPQIKPEQIILEIHDWLNANESIMRPLFVP